MSDRMSTHNIVHLTPFFLKGEILLAQTLFFARSVFPHLPTHIVASGEAIWKYLPSGLPRDLEKRALVVLKRQPHAREFVWRNYLAGSLARALKEGADPYDLFLDRNLPLMHHFPQAILTPTEKSEDDKPLKTRHVVRQCKGAVHLTRQAVEVSTAYLRTRNIALIDTKLEADEEMLLDEFMTGDCSRMAEQDKIEEGKEPPFLDKEPVRKMAEQKWKGGPKVPLEFSDSETAMGIWNYHRAFEMITDVPLHVFQQTALSYEKHL